MVVVEYQNKEYQFADGTKVRRIIKKLNINPETVLTIYDQELITDDKILTGGRLQIISVISGG